MFRHDKIMSLQRSNAVPSLQLTASSPLKMDGCKLEDDISFWEDVQRLTCYFEGV